MAGQRFISVFTDSFGFLRTALTGVTTWTDRQLRNTGADRLGSITNTHD